MRRADRLFDIIQMLRVNALLLTALCQYPRACD